MLTLMAMSFSILWSVSTGPLFQGFIYSICLFIYIIIISSPKRRYSYVIRNSIFFIDWNISETWTRIKLKQLSKCCSIFLWKKKCIVLKGKKLFFSVKQPCHRTSSNFILSMFSRKIYSKFYVVFTTYWKI